MNVSSKSRGAREGLLVALVLALAACSSNSKTAADAGPATCGASCTENAQCDFGHACRGGCCTPGCDRNDDCTNGQVCEQDRCVDPDGGAPADGGAVADGGGTPTGSCASTPTQCSDIGPDPESQYYGCCVGDTIYWCDDQSGTWSLNDIDCSSRGERCGYEPSVESNYCVTDVGDGGVSLDGGLGTGPGTGPGPDCPSLPPMRCTLGTAQCGELTTFDPRTTDAWDDYPLNGETASNQYRSFLRRDVIMLLKYASEKVLCKTAGWSLPGNGPPIGLGDMSEANGAIPGTSIGDPGHPAGTHVNGRDIDMGYYQVGTANNRLRPICVHSINGADQYHCTQDPIYLDVWRSAAYIGFMLEHSNVRVIGVDGRAGALIAAAMASLCQDGWMTTTACANRGKLAYEVTDTGRGWYRFHHHHMHLSFSPPSSKPTDRPSRALERCLTESCDRASLSAYRARMGLEPVSASWPAVLEERHLPKVPPFKRRRR